MRESLGAALLLNGDAAAAEQVFRDDLRENPRNSRSHFGLMESLRAQGKRDAAAFVEVEFNFLTLDAKRICVKGRACRPS